MGNENIVLTSGEPKLPVARFEFKDSSQKSWEELFDGFDSLEAITYSSGLTFINKVLEKFKTATIILGSDKTISMELNQIMAFQTATLQDLNKLYNKKHSRVHQMLKEESLHFWIAKSKMSHEKLFILKKVCRKPCESCLEAGFSKGKTGRSLSESEATSIYKSYP